MARYTARIAREQTDKFLREEELLSPYIHEDMQGIYATINVKAGQGESRARFTSMQGVWESPDMDVHLKPFLIGEQLKHDGYSISYEYDEKTDWTFLIVEW